MAVRLAFVGGFAYKTKERFGVFNDGFSTARMD